MDKFSPDSVVEILFTLERVRGLSYPLFTFLIDGEVEIALNKVVEGYCGYGWVISCMGTQILGGTSIYFGLYLR